MNCFFTSKVFRKEGFPILLTKILNTYVLLTKNGYKHPRAARYVSLTTNCKMAYSSWSVPLPNFPTSHILHYRHSASSTSVLVNNTYHPLRSPSANGFLLNFPILTTGTSLTQTIAPVVVFIPGSLSPIAQDHFHQAVFKNVFSLPTLHFPHCHNPRQIFRVSHHDYAQDAKFTSLPYNQPNLKLILPASLGYSETFNAFLLFSRHAKLPIIFLILSPTPCNARQTPPAQS